MNLLTLWFLLPGISVGIAFGAAVVAGTPPAIELETVLDGLSNPVYVTHSGDGLDRLFVVEQPGRIRVLQPRAASPTVFLDITSRIRLGGERGLLGLAFHPQFTGNGRFFVNYTRRNDGATVVAEYRVSESNPDVADTEESVILTVAQPFSNHNGGMIAFGPDGFLYIGLGDGGSAFDPGNRAQNIELLLGKILRIDVDHPESSQQPYSSPSTNPFFGPTPGRDEIFAWGLRNPWRFSFDRRTGELYVGDVGQNTREEIDIISSGGNLGWRVFEASLCTNLGPAACDRENFTFPIAEYGHSGERCSVTGGYVYRGVQFTLPLGSYVYGDFCSGEIFLLQEGSASVLLDSGLAIASFGEDESGEIYVADLEGRVLRIVNPNPPLLHPLHFPRLAARADKGFALSGDQHTGLAVVNLDSSDATLRLAAYDTAGGLMSGPEITNPVAMTLDSGHQIPMVDTELFGAGLLNGHSLGWIELESTVEKVIGFFLMFNHDLTLLDGADVSASTLSEFVLPELQASGFTQIHVANPGAEPALLTLELSDSDGVARSPAASRMVNARGALAEFFTDLFPGMTARAEDYLRVTSDRQVVPFEFFGIIDRFVLGLNGQDATAAATTLFCPQYVVGGPIWQTTLSIVNLDSNPGTLTLEFIGDDATRIVSPRELSLPARGKIHLSDQNFFLDAGSTLTQGYLKIMSSGPRIAGSVVFGARAPGAFAAALPLVTAREAPLVFSQIASSTTYFTGLAIVNPNDEPVTATVEVFDAGGKRMVSAVEVIPAGQRRSKLLIEFFPSLAGQDIMSGYILVTVDRGVAGFAVFGTQAGTALSAVPAQRVGSPAISRSNQADPHRPE